MEHGVVTVGQRDMGDKVVLGLAIGSGYTRAAIATASAQSADSGSNGNLGAAATAASLSRPSIVVNADGDRGIPTVVARRGEGAEEEWLIGEAAKSAMLSRGSSVISWAGPVLMRGLKGETEDDDEDDEAPSVEEVCAKLLQHVLEQAEALSGESPSDCVLAVPSSFTEEHRRAMIHTANMSGLNVTGVIREPAAALLAFELTNTLPISKTSPSDKPARVLVFDFGESHCDVSIIEDDQGLLRVLYTYTSDAGLGGRAVTEKLVDFCLKEFQRKSGCDARESKRAMTKLRRECEIAVRTLSTLQQADIAIDSLYEGCDLRTVISRARFEGECIGIFREAIAAIDKSLEATGIPREEINLVLLVGGASRMPKLQAWVQGAFPETTEVRPADSNPEEAIALGAAIQAQLLARSPTVLDSHPVSTTLPCSPLTFGLMQCNPADGDMPSSPPQQPVLLAKRGALLPVEHAARFVRADSSQRTCGLRVVATHAADFSPGASELLAVADVVIESPEEEIQLSAKLSTEGVLRLCIKAASTGTLLKEVVIRPHNTKETA